MPVYVSEPGLHYNWHRYYHPETGRYITADPIGLAGGMNLYAYVQNDPVNLIDPTGEWVAPAIVGVYSVGAVLIFKDCMERCTGKKIDERDKECARPPEDCAQICIKYALLMGFGADPLGSSSSTVGEKIGGAMSK